MSQHWRLIPALTAAGTTQMAIDRWLLEQLIAARQPPVLRFYQWFPAAISLGYHQTEWPEQWRHLTWQGIPIELVRRPSGGRAVLHQGDLTYAIAMPLTTSRQAAYQQICDALIAAWRRLDVDLHYGTAGRSYRHQANCFALATPADLVTSSGYKLIGSAQLRRDRYLLQHGSIQLWPDLALGQQVFGPDSMPKTSRPKAIPLQPDAAFLGHLQQLIQDELARSLQIEFTVQPLTAVEQTAIEAQAAPLRNPAGF